jgi:hypothetical protein
MSLRTSGTPPVTALKFSKWALVVSAITAATVDLPQPGGPRRWRSEDCPAQWHGAAAYWGREGVTVRLLRPGCADASAPQAARSCQLQFRGEPLLPQKTSSRQDCTACPCSSAHSGLRVFFLQPCRLCALRTGADNSIHAKEIHTTNQHVCPRSSPSSPGLCGLPSRERHTNIRREALTVTVRERASCRTSCGGADRRS